MATSAVPAVIDALVTKARAALPDLSVHDGFGVTDDPGDFLMVGVEDPDLDGATFSAEAQQSWAHVNHTARDEEGDITCAALSWTGDGDEAGQKAARDAVYATTAALENVLRADPTLGVATVLWASFGTSQQLKQAQDQHGAIALLLFRVHFKARI